MSTWSRHTGSRGGFSAAFLLIAGAFTAAGCRSAEPGRSGAGSDTLSPTALRTPATPPADTATMPPRDTTPAKPPTRAPRPAPAPSPAPAARPDRKAPATPAQPAPAPRTAAPAAAPEAAPLHDQYHPAPRDTLSADVYNGWKQYELNCSRCHGEYGVGTSFAPALVVSLRDDGAIPTKELFIATVCAGRKDKGMPAWCELGLEMDKIQEMYAYLKGRADGKTGPGRPALRGSQ